MADGPDPWWVTWGARAISAALLAFLAWFLLNLVFGSPGACIWPGGC